MTSIAFAEPTEAYWSVFRAIAEREYIVNITYTKSDYAPPVPGDKLMVIGADDDGIIVCEYGDDGTYWRNSSTHIGYDEIKTLTIL
jgi:hypothetical protein